MKRSEEIYTNTSVENKCDKSSTKLNDKKTHSANVLLSSLSKQISLCLCDIWLKLGFYSEAHNDTSLSMLSM